MFETVRLAPVSNGLMAVSILGFFLTVIYTDRLGASWSFAFGLLCIIIFIASFISMTYGPVREV